MRNFKLNNFTLTAGVFLCLLMALAMNPSTHSRGSGSSMARGVDQPPSTEAAVNNWTFFTVREDLRRCISPLCGGFWVRGVNQKSTQCANGSWSSECYVAEIDWNGQSQGEPNRALLRGSIVPRTFERFGNLGVLRVNESWQAATDKPAVGILYRVRDRGVRCITHPCLTHVESVLNAASARNIAGVDLAGAGAGGDLIGQAVTAMKESAGVIVAGSHAVVTGPGGRAQTLRATQFYLRASSPATSSPPVSALPGSKPCFKTGCSAQICADHNVISTCEFRPEYACYQKAVCERQGDGNCGFTRTPELAACLARR